jgi:mannose-6-phosphate isomerase-like protein (cupin superfamily)
MIRIFAAVLLALAFVVQEPPSESTPSESPPTWEAFQLEDLIERAEGEQQHWVQFLDRSSLYAGLYRLPKGGTDGQTPHDLDEVYYVAKGRAVLEVDGERTAAEPGSILFVAAGAPHRFVDIEQDLEVVVLFSKATPEPGAGR